MQTRNKRLVKNTVFLYIRMLLIMGVTLYTSRIVLEVLGFTDFGVYNVVGGVVAIFGFLNGAMSGASSRFLSFDIGQKNYDRLRKTFNVLLLSHIGIAVCVVILCETIGLWLLFNKLVMPENQMGIILWVYQISVISSVLSIIAVPFSSVLISHEDMNIYAYVGLAEAALKLTAVFLLTTIPGSKILVYAILLLGVQVIINIFYIIYCLYHYECCKIKICKERAMYREIFGFVGGDLIGNISVLAQGQGLNILLNMFFGPVVNAARGITYQVQGAVQQFSNNFTTAVRPQIIKLCAEKNFTEMFLLVDRASCFSYYLMWLIILPILLNTHYILTLWLKNYPEYTIQFLDIVLWISLVQTLKTPRTMVFHGLGKVKLVNAVIGTFLIMTFPISYIALKLGATPTSVFGISLAIIILTEFASVYILKKYIKFSATKYFVSVHLRCIIVSLISGIIPFLYHSGNETTSFTQLLLSCCISTSSILVTVLMIGMDKTTKNNLLVTIKNKLHRK